MGFSKGKDQGKGRRRIYRLEGMHSELWKPDFRWGTGQD